MLVPEKLRQATQLMHGRMPAYTSHYSFLFCKPAIWGSLLGGFPRNGFSACHLAPNTMSRTMAGSMSIPFSVIPHRTTGLGKRFFFCILLIMPVSSSSRSLLLRILGLSRGFERRRLLKRSTCRNPISARMSMAHLRPSIPRSGLIGRAAKNSLSTFRMLGSCLGICWYYPAESLSRL